MLAIIMFNGSKLKKVVIFKKDSVLSKRSRINGLQVFVGVAKMFTKLMDTDEIDVRYKRNYLYGWTFRRPKFSAQKELVANLVNIPPPPQIHPITKKR